jgi:hypothetical protein
LYKYLKEHRRKVVYFPLIVYWIVLLIATSIPTDDFPRVLMTVGDKIKHFSAYLILGGYLSLAFSLQERVPKLQKHFILGGILVALFMDYWMNFIKHLYQVGFLNGMIGLLIYWEHFQVVQLSDIF